MRSTGDQAKTACGSLKLCAGNDSKIEGATHTVAQKWQRRHMPEPDSREDKESEGAEDEREAAS